MWFIWFTFILFYVVKLFSFFRKFYTFHFWVQTISADTRQRFVSFELRSHRAGQARECFLNQIAGKEYCLPSARWSGLGSAYTGFWGGCLWLFLYKGRFPCEIKPLPPCSGADHRQGMAFKTWYHPGIFPQSRCILKNCHW